MAIANIFDNSISAGARSVRINVRWEGDDSRSSILGDDKALRGIGCTNG